MNTIETYLENPVKRHILTMLVNNHKLSYSELFKKLRYNDIDNVLFNYHLQHLVKSKIITKSEEGYSMSVEGRHLTANVAPNGEYFPTFTCRYRMYLLDFENKRILYQFWNRYPWKGDRSPISAKILPGENTDDKANACMLEKTNLTTDMKTVGTLRKMIKSQQGELLDDTMYFISYSSEFTGDFKSANIDGDKIDWVDFETAIEFEKQNRNGGTHQVEILERFIKKDFSPFFFEDTLVLEKF